MSSLKQPNTEGREEHYKRHEEPYSQSPQRGFDACLCKWVVGEHQLSSYQPARVKERAIVKRVQATAMTAIPSLRSCFSVRGALSKSLMACTISRSNSVGVNST